MLKLPEMFGESENKMAEVHGNRTHQPNHKPGSPDLKSGRATSALSASFVVSVHIVQISIIQDILK